MRTPKRPTFREEIALWKRGIDCVIGVDEVGRGAFAGPVVAAAVVLDPTRKELQGIGIHDSKLLRPQKRHQLAKEIKAKSMAWSIAEVGVLIINRVGIGKATQMAFRKAIEELLNNKTMQQLKNYYVLVDGFHVRYLKRVGMKNQKAIVKGDQKCLSIAAASIIAKVHRDGIMKQLSKKFPQYGFSRHKGYGTKEHQEAIRVFGLARIHRTSFNLTKFLFSHAPGVK